MDHVLAVAARFTTTPENVWFALWDGWGGEAVQYSSKRPSRWSTFWAWTRLWWAATPRTEKAPTLDLDGGRGYWLYRGPVTGSSDWGVSDEGVELTFPAALTWPDDHAWFIASDVDPVWFTVSGPAGLAAALLADPSLVCRPSIHGKPPPDDEWPNEQE